MDAEDSRIDSLGSGTVPDGKAGRLPDLCKDAVRLASNASSTAKKTVLLALAEGWLGLGDAQDRRAKADQGFRVIEPNGCGGNTRTASSLPRRASAWSASRPMKPMRPIGVEASGLQATRTHFPLRAPRVPSQSSPATFMRNLAPLTAGLFLRAPCTNPRALALTKWAC